MNPGKQVHLQEIFAGLRDGYVAAAQRFFGDLGASARAAGAQKDTSDLETLAVHINDAVRPWVAETSASLVRDMDRVAREVLADILQDESYSEMLVEQAMSELQRPPPPASQVPPLSVSASRASDAAIRRGVGTVLVLWLLIFFVVPIEMETVAYLTTPVVGLYIGRRRYQAVRAREQRVLAASAASYLEAASAQLQDEYQTYVSAYVRALVPRVQQYIS